MVGEACDQARTARLPVELTMRDGQSVKGVPAPRHVATDDPAEVDSTGYAEDFAIDGTSVHLDDIVELRLWCSDAGGASG